MRRGIGRLRAGGNFNPIPGLFAAGEQGAWYDPSDFSSMFQDSAGTTPVTATTQPVGKILDKSGRGNHLIQATTTSRPTLQQDGSGFFYLNFDGVDDGLASAATVDFTATSKMSVFAGIAKSSDAATGMALELGASGNTAGNFYLSAPESGSNYGTRNGGNGYGNSPFAAPISNVITMQMDTLGGTVAAAMVVRLNAVANTANPTAFTAIGGTFSNSTVYVGRRTGTTLPFNGRMYQLVVRGAVSDAATVTGAERYVGSKMGIAL